MSNKENRINIGGGAIGSFYIRIRGVNKQALQSELIIVFFLFFITTLRACYKLLTSYNAVNNQYRNIIKSTFSQRMQILWIHCMHAYKL